MTLLTVVDLGKTTCRVRTTGGGVCRELQVPGAPGLGRPAGVDSALHSIGHAGCGPAAGLVSVGAAGALAAPDRAALLARRLVDERGYAAAVVTSDAITAHLGALGGAAGVVVIAGTGAVAVAVDARSGSVAVVDGAGPGEGDVGGGAWIGARALEHATDEGGTLAALARRVLGPRWRDPAVRTQTEQAWRRARLVPGVGELARRGDDTAYRLLTRSAEAIAATAATAAGSVTGTAPVDVCLVGGLRALGEPWFTTYVECLQRNPRVRRREPSGDALDGAALLAARTDLVHERHVHRVDCGEMSS